MDVKNRTATEPAHAPSYTAREEGTEGTSSFWRSMGIGLLYALCGYWLGGAALPFSAHPFGIALLCASDRKVFYIYAGLCLGAWDNRYRTALLVTYSALLLLRLLVRLLLDSSKEKSMDGTETGQALESPYSFLFAEHLSLRAATATIGAFGIGLYRLIEGDFLYYDLYGTILGTLSAPTAVLLFSGIYGGSKPTRVWRQRLAQICLCCALCFSLGDWKVYGISAAVFGGLFSALYLVRKQGTMTGVLAGTLCGLVTSPLLAPGFAFGALAMGLLHEFSLTLGVSAAFLAATAWSSYVRGMGVLDGVLPALIAVCLLFPVLDRLFFSPRVREKEKDKVGKIETEKTDRKEVPLCSPLSLGEEESLRLRDTNRRLHSLCESLSSLSYVMEQMSRQTQAPTATDLRQICESSFESSCTSCSQRESCWGEEFTRTSREIGTLSAALHTHGKVTHADAASSMTLRCSRLPDILEEINHRAAEHRRQTLLCDRTEVFALDYGALSGMLDGTVRAGEEAYRRDEALTSGLCLRFTRENVGVTGVTVLGSGRRRVILMGEERERLSAEADRIREAVREVCPFSTDGGVLDDEMPRWIFTERLKLKVSSAQRTVCAEGEAEYCGDTVGLFTNEEGHLYGLISDGMGAGQEAALTSGIAGLFLRKMLAAGNSCDIALKMLNGFLRNRGSGSLHECSATVDLMELDLMAGRAYFYKSGAAPTYVFREGSLFKLRSRTVPMGILRDTDIRRINFDVSPGDVIVMVSDGVTQLKEECPWLFDLLRSQGGEGGRGEVSTERLADLIVKYAKEEGSTDDLSVLVVKIEDNREKSA
ncbi:MAG: SpoIIE family protein phosphatase [Clostridia bacterium]|nr:SpoIIE family protein phosphatase [Clostridia bacterium]